MSLTGLIEEGCNEGVFTDSLTEYAGQFKDTGAHGKGVSKWGVYQDSGDWEDGKRSGYGERLFRGGAVYQGQWSRGDRHGYGVYVNDNRGKYQGQWMKGYGKHGLIRYTAPDGTVRDTIWQRNIDTGAPCNANDAVKEAEEGLCNLFLLE